jgi:hypothetical protein
MLLCLFTLLFLFDFLFVNYWGWFILDFSLLLCFIFTIGNNFLIMFLWFYDFFGFSNGYFFGKNRCILFDDSCLFSWSLNLLCFLDSLFLNFWSFSYYRSWGFFDNFIIFQLSNWGSLWLLLRFSCCNWLWFYIFLRSWFINFFR